MADQRAQARSLMDSGMPLVIAAFNLEGSRAWRFDRDTRARAESLIRDLIELFHESEIEAAPAPAPAMIPCGDPHLREARVQLQQNMRWIAAREDRAFQGFLSATRGAVYRTLLRQRRRRAP